MKYFLDVYDEKELFHPHYKNTVIRPSRSGIILIENGCFKVNFNGKPMEYNSGHIMFVSPKDFFYFAEFSEDLKISTVLFKSSELRSQINFDFNRYDAYRIANSQLIDNNFVVPEQIFKFLSTIIVQIRFYLNNERVIPLKLQILDGLASSFFCSVLSFLLENSEKRIRPGSRKEEVAMVFIGLLSEHFRSERELKFYADRLHISAKYIFLSVKETTGKPPKHLIDSFAVNEAKYLLMNTRLQISQISNTLNFSDQYAFGKYFKKHVGVSPNKFRSDKKQIVTI